MINIAKISHPFSVIIISNCSGYPFYMHHSYSLKYGKEGKSNPPFVETLPSQGFCNSIELSINCVIGWEWIICLTILWVQSLPEYLKISLSLVPGLETNTRTAIQNFPHFFLHCQPLYIKQAKLSLQLPKFLVKHHTFPERS